MPTPNHLHQKTCSQPGSLLKKPLLSPEMNAYLLRLLDLQSTKWLRVLYNHGIRKWYYSPGHHPPQTTDNFLFTKRLLWKRSDPIPFRFVPNFCNYYNPLDKTAELKPIYHVHAHFCYHSNNNYYSLTDITILKVHSEIRLFELFTECDSNEFLVHLCLTSWLTAHKTDG